MKSGTEAPLKQLDAAYLPFGVDLFFGTFGVHIVKLALMIETCNLAGMYHRVVEGIRDRCHVWWQRMTQWNTCVVSSEASSRRQLGCIGVDVACKVVRSTWCSRDILQMG